MSRRKTDEEYRQTGAFRFFRWLSGSKDAYVDTVEMKPQTEAVETKEEEERRIEEHKLAIEKAYDSNNRAIIVFNKIYRLVAAIFTVFLLVSLIYAVSYLPQIGDADNATSNEVARRYIENGVQETGAVNIVSGMILTYRAFDTFGETNVLFIATCWMRRYSRRWTAGTTGASSLRATRFLRPWPPSSVPLSLSLPYTSCSTDIYHPVAASRVARCSVRA